MQIFMQLVLPDSWNITNYPNLELLFYPNHSSMIKNEFTRVFSSASRRGGGKPIAFQSMIILCQHIGIELYNDS